MRRRKPKAYRDRTEMLVDEYQRTVNAEARNKLVERIVLQWRGGKFRFLEGNPEDEAVHEMPMSSAVKIVKTE